MAANTIERRSTLRTSLVERPSAAIWVALLALLVVALLVSPNFFQVRNLQDILRLSSILAIVTMGQVLVMITGGIDLSVGAVIGITAVAIAEAARPDGPSLGVALFIVLVVAIGVGLTNGLLVTRRGVPPFIATFGMFVFLEGARLAYTKGSVSGTVPESLRNVGRGTVIGIPWPVLAMVVVVSTLAVFARSSQAGRGLTMTGANQRMAALSGIRTRLVKTSAYVASAVLAAGAGVFFTGFTGYVDRFAGRGADLDSLAAALLGGTQFVGGRASFVGSAVGALFLVSLSNLIVVNGLALEWQLIAKGSVLIFALALQTIGRAES